MDRKVSVGRLIFMLTSLVLLTACSGETPDTESPSSNGASPAMGDVVEPAPAVEPEPMLEPAAEPMPESAEPNTEQ